MKNITLLLLTSLMLIGCSNTRETVGRCKVIETDEICTNASGYVYPGVICYCNSGRGKAIK